MVGSPSVVTKPGLYLDGANPLFARLSLLGLGHDVGPLLRSRLALSTSVANDLFGRHSSTSQTKSGLCLATADGIERCRHDVRHSLLLVPSRILPHS
jgi:hypothetical protein